MATSDKVKGFTLVELLVVLVILGLIAGLAGPRVLKYLGAAKSDTAMLQIEELGAGLDLFYLELGRYPNSVEGLNALVNIPSQLPRWNGPYLRKSKIPPDPWGHPYNYKAPGEHGVYDLYTFGADNSEGGDGEDKDVVSW